MNKIKTAVTQHYVFLLLSIIILIGAGLRFYGLTVQSLWNDELSGWRRSNYETFREIIPEIPPDHPPGFQVFLYFWIHNVGDSETLLRLPSAMVGTAAILAMFLLGRKLYSDKEGLIAAAMTAVFWTPLYYSQEARANIMILLCAILSVYWLVDIGRALRDGKALPKTAVAGYVVTAVLACYLHYFGLFFTVLQAIFIGLYFIRQPKVWPKLLLIYGLIFIAYLPWLFEAIMALTMGAPDWMLPPESDAFIKFLQFLFNQSAKLTNLVLILWAILGVTILWRIFKRPDQIRRILFSADSLLLFWLVVPFAIIYIKSVISAPALNNRNLIILLPSAYLLLARAITQLPFRRLLPPLVALLVLGLFARHLFWEKDYYHEITKEQFREAVAFVAAHEADYPNGDVIGWVWSKPYLDYYFVHFESPQRVDILAGEVGDIVAVQEFIQSSSSRYLWYVRAHREPDEAFMAFIESELDPILHESFYRADVWLFANE